MTSIPELLSRIRKTWLRRVAHNMARGAGVRADFETELNRFYDLLIQATETGDPEWLAPVLLDWITASTQSELQEGQKSITAVLNQMVILTYEVAKEMLTEEEALELLGTLLPFYTFALEKAARYEMEAHVGYISNQLEQVQQKLERLDQSKSSFIAVAAHELKTPLTLIEGYATMLHEMVEQNKAGNLDTLLAGVNTGIQRLRNIVDDMIDISLIDNHLLSLTFQPVWLKNICALLRSDLEDFVTARHQTMQIDTFPGIEQMIYADPERLYQAFHNILINAIKFTPDSGKITIGGRTLPGFIEVTISDTGIGISPEDQLMIFEKFGILGPAAFHSSSKINFKGGGPGLGLPIARGIIEAHGGTLWVESEGCDEEKCPGSTFHVLLPIRTEASDPKIAKLFSTISSQRTEPDAQENP